MESLSYLTPSDVYSEIDQLDELSDPLPILPNLETDIPVHNFMPDLASRVSDSIRDSISDTYDVSDFAPANARHWDGDASHSKPGPNLRRRLRRLRKTLRRGRRIIRYRVMSLSERLEKTLHM